LGKKALRQQHGSSVGEGLFSLPTANSEVVGEADGVGTVWSRRGFANNFSFPTGMLLGKNPFPNSRTLPSVLGLLAKISFPTAEFSCWERVSSPTAQVLDVGKALPVGEATVIKF
jgi:hypothetical protein